ncbi:MAG TPA: glutamyl-tRNA reductase [Mycobacteriales bacterium]|nr:glutamyl-tRNA reductase [Mycobacteriales bacterium]
MSLVVAGISYRTASVPLLEQMTRGVDDTAGVLAELRSAETVTEVVVLRTCNRVEIYADTPGFHAGVDTLTDLLARRCGLPLEELAPYLYVHWEGQAVLHLFRVAAGLDSMVVGESQILGQLRSAYASADAAGATGRTLHELVQEALRVGKRVQSETALGRAGHSLVSVGLEQAAEAVGPLAGRSALVVGAGSMSALSVAALRRAGVVDITIANRTARAADELAASVGGASVDLSALPQALGSADIVVTCTGSPDVVLGAPDIAAAMKARRSRPLVLLDLALPRDVDPSARDLAGVVLLDLDTVHDVLRQTAAGSEVETAQTVVTEEVAHFLAGQRARRVDPTVVALRSRADEVVAAELARLAARLPDLDDRARREVQAAVRRVVDKLLHAPTVRVRELAQEPAGLSYADALRELFGLEGPTPVAAAAPASEETP